MQAITIGCPNAVIGFFFLYMPLGRRLCYATTGAFCLIMGTILRDT